MERGMQMQVLATVALAMLLGGVIGAEREFARKPAGLRTLMLVAGAAALLVTLGDAVLAHYALQLPLLSRAGADGTGELIRSDPIRIIEAIFTGVSFLGAGTIIRGERGKHVEGLTTAASILFAAAVGISVALHQFVIGAGAAVLALVTLRGFGPLERKAFRGK